MEIPSGWSRLPSGKGFFGRRSTLTPALPETKMEGRLFRSRWNPARSLRLEVAPIREATGIQEGCLLRLSRRFWTLEPGPCVLALPPSPQGALGTCGNLTKLGFPD